MMLGKTAGGLFWMCRYLERSANNARLIEAGVTDCRIGVRVPAAREAATEYLATVVDAFDSATGRVAR